VGVIYSLVLNTEPDRVRYIGLTTQKRPEQRLAFHRWASRRGDRSALYAWMRKHGDQNVEMRVIESCDTIEDLRDAERFWIAALGGPRSDLLNLTEGGDGTSGYVPSEEQSRAHSERMQGEGNSFHGKRHTSESRARMSDSHTGHSPTSGFSGRTHGPDTRAKIRAAITGIKRDVRWYHNKFHVVGQSQSTMPDCPDCT
jgi:group I intron endonuclease